MFVDEAEIFVKGGDGGDGFVGFRRESYVPRGGPDGGDGGHGGGVYMEAVENLDTLLDFLGHHHWKAEDGRAGQTKKKTGRSGNDIIVQVPLGTLVYDKDAGILLKDLTQHGQRICVSHGGRGGRGNVHFATATEQAPRHAEPGRKGRERSLRLELKLIADVGLVGMPNAGKSTLISHVSSARPKIADYPFTTLHPMLGIAEISRHRRMVLADLPGLIEGAHEGTGLGDQFLRHIERTRVIVHLLDIMPMDGSDPTTNYEIIRNELSKYSAKLTDKPEIIVANKMDLTDSEDAYQKLKEKLNREILPISAVTGRGLPQLLDHLWRLIEQHKEEEKLRQETLESQIDTYTGETENENTSD
ncbi:MAG: GTPase ObgE [Phycisphaerae bacterium]